MRSLISGDLPLWVIPLGIAVALLETYIERKLKAAGKWPNTGGNGYLDNLIWVAVLLVIVVPVALISSY